MEELRGHFRPELINRIDEIIPFLPVVVRGRPEHPAALAA